MKAGLFSVFILLASLTAHGKSVNCFSKYYGANQFTISISAEIESDNTITNVVVKDTGDGFEASIPSVTAVDGNHRASGPYANYQDFNLRNDNKDKYALRVITLLLPNELTTLNGRFVGYASDPNADGSGSDGYQKLLCNAR
jgi:hypothetical protein